MRLRAICVSGLHGHHAGAGRADRRPYPTLRRLALARPRPPNTTAAAASSSRRPTPIPVRASVRPRVADAAATAAGFVVTAAPDARVTASPSTCVPDADVAAADGEAPEARDDPGAADPNTCVPAMAADLLTDVPRTFEEAPDPVALRAGDAFTAATPVLFDSVAACSGPAWAGAFGGKQLIQKTLCFPAPGAPSWVAVSFTWKPCFFAVRPVNNELRWYEPPPMGATVGSESNETVSVIVPLVRVGA